MAMQSFAEMFPNLAKYGNPDVLSSPPSVQGPQPAKKAKLRRFDEPTQSQNNRWDKILIVEGKKFYVIASHLATHADFFDRMFFGEFGDKDKVENTLHEVKADDFQNFLEAINGELCIDDSTVDGILKLADFWGAKTAKSRCEHFLLKESKKSLKEKFEIALKYHIEELRDQQIAKVDNVKDMKAMLPDDVATLDKPIMATLFKKSLAFGADTEQKAVGPDSILGNIRIIPYDEPCYESLQRSLESRLQRRLEQSRARLNPPVVQIE